MKEIKEIDLHPDLKRIKEIAYKTGVMVSDIENKYGYNMNKEDIEILFDILENGEKLTIKEIEDYFIK